MRWNNPQIKLVPRSIANCIDFAILFFGKHLLLFLKLWAIITIPCCLLMYFLASLFELGGWTACLIFFLASAPLGALVTLATTPVLTGKKCSMRELMNQLEAVGPLILMKVIILRITTGLAALLLVIPGIWIALRFRFVIEKSSLESMEEHLHNESTDQLIRDEWGNAMGQALVITLFCSLLFVSLFVTFDAVSNYIFMFPILLGRIAEIENPDGLRYLLWYDPWVLMLAIATAMLVYPIGRLAWFFCYVDCRVRYDCWNIELKINDEVRHMETKR